MKIVNRHRTNDWDLYGGRGTPYGNPFVIGKDGDRESVIQKYKAYFEEKIKTDEVFRAEVLKLEGKTVACSCLPLPCHLSVISDWLESQKKKKLTPLSASKLKALEDCSWSYYCKYTLKLPQPGNSGSSRGTVVHTIFECLINPRHRKYVAEIENGTIPKSIERLLLKNAKKLNVADEEHLEMMREMIFTGVANDFLCVGAKSVSSEDEFSIEVGECLINGFIDKLAVYEDDSIAIYDYKSSKDVFKKEELEYNFQNLMYSLSVWKQTGKIPSVKFIFLRFPKKAIQPAPKCSEAQLKGFESYLSQIATYIKEFNEAKAKSNYAADNKDKMWLCGRAWFPGQLKKDGTKMWHCPFKFKFDYFSGKDKNGKIRTAYDEKELVGCTEITKMEYAGCPRWNRESKDFDF